MNNAIDFLGKKVRDKVTSFTGIVTSVSYDLYGCIQLLVTPEVDNKHMTKQDSYWYDINRVDIVNNKRVMPLPKFNKSISMEDIAGPANKPIK